VFGPRSVLGVGSAHAPCLSVGSAHAPLVEHCEATMYEKEPVLPTGSDVASLLNRRMARVRSGVIPSSYVVTSECAKLSLLSFPRDEVDSL
jgi:hypothetical protein